MADTIRPDVGSGEPSFLVNTDTSHGRGIHWLAVRIFADGDRESALIFNSLGVNEPIDNWAAISGALADGGRAIKFWPGASQLPRGIGDQLCGYYALIAADIMDLAPSWRLAVARLTRTFNGLAADPTDIERVIREFRL
jgi:hypothetical protein